MKRLFLFLVLALFVGSNALARPDRTENSDIEVYLLTCGPGQELYATWGHTALRVKDLNAGTDIVYNWGVFDFSTKHFAWKFAKGRLEYMLAYTTYDRFLDEYIYSNREVISQRVNLDRQEINTMLMLIQENLKPENVKYRYDFFYDDCSTRVRDLLENAVGDNLLYPPEDIRNQTTFAKEIERFSKRSPWLDFGIDMLMGREGRKRTTLRDRMFLPDELSKGLSQLVIRRDGLMVPLLANPVTVVESTAVWQKTNVMLAPISVFSFLLIIVLILSATLKSKLANNIMDIIIFFLFSVLAVMIFFFNFFTDHIQMRGNMHILWLSPFVITSLIALILDKEFLWSFRTVFVFTIIFTALAIILPKLINPAFIPLSLILAVRSLVRGKYPWNPLKLEAI
ncbi:MAG: DUF4105 domain-containing protein [Bacteroidales bacterium]|jgi:hypothetical protein